VTAPLAEWLSVAIRYPGAAQDAIGPVSLAVARGERVLLLGPSGCGKSSLLMALTGLVPQAIPAAVSGARRIGGRDADARAPSAWADSVAVLFQAPERNLCGMRIADEVGFALEQRRLPEAAIRAGVARALASTGFAPADGRRRVSALSGGEKQRVALAAMLAQGADLLLVDEPTAHLDAAAARRLRALLCAFGPRQGAVIVDHRLDGLLGAVDRVVALDHEGRMVAEGPPRRLFREARATLDALGVWTPATAALDAALTEAGAGLPTLPLSTPEAAAALDRLASPARTRAADAVAGWLAARDERPPRAPGGVVARLDQAACTAPDGRRVLSGVSLDLRAGSVTALLGANGAGKTTLALALTGLSPLAAGRREGPPGGMAFQNPEHVFVAGSVADELRASMPGGACPGMMAQTLRDWGLAGLERRHPLDLSEGQKRRLALAAVAVAPSWPLIALDEPTAGLDAAGAAFLEARVRGLAEAGKAVVLVTHEADLARRLADRLVAVGDGGACDIGGPEALDDATARDRWRLPAPVCAPLRGWLARQGARAPC
jgi:energy-coupling factor transport system ATP-binding protein